MVAHWRFNKRLVIGERGEYMAKFFTLMEDKRDIMCDSVVPQWGVSDEKRNRMVEIFDGGGWGRLVPVFSARCGKDDGNAMYRELKRLKSSEEVRRWIARKEEQVR